MAIEDRVTSEGYVEVGSRLGYGEVLLTLPDAERMRATVEQVYFGNIPVKTPLLSETEDKTVAKKGFCSGAEENTGAVDIFFSSAQIHHTDVDCWQLGVRQVRVRRQELNAGEQRIETRYNITVFDQLVVEALRKVRIIRGIGDKLTVADLEEQVDNEHLNYLQRRAYELPMTPEDCDKIEIFLTQSVKRYLATRRV